MTIKLTEGQEKALETTRALLKSETSDFGIVAGVAGTGKTTALQAISQELGAPKILTPTGKAALRAREATGLNASTIHRWLYNVVEDPKTRAPKWVKKNPLELARPHNGLIVVDEASMLSDNLWDDLWEACQACDAKLLLVGDPFQLPPVNPKRPGWSVFESLRTVHKTVLTEVVRQALDSPIIRASMAVRTSEEEALRAIGELRLVDRQQLLQQAAENPASAVIVWRNDTRRKLNHEIRSVLGYPAEEISANERLIVTSNNYELDRYNGEPVLFSAWEQGPKDQEAVRDPWEGSSAFISYGVARIEGAKVLLSPEEVLSKSGKLSPRIISKCSKSYARAHFGYDKSSAPPHLNADLGYAITAHKAQGSEWDEVCVVIENPNAFSSYDGRRWIYTAITRAKCEISLFFS